MKKHILIVTTLLLFFVPELGAQVNILPFEDHKFIPIEKTRNHTLEAELKTALNKNPQWKKLIKAKRMCVGVVDISDPEQPRYASVNGKHMMYAASLPKIAILVSVMDAIDAGELEMTPEIDQMLHQMIRVSSNSASTALIDLIGFERIEQTMKDKRFMLYDESKFGGLWVGKRYAAGGKRNPDPMKGISHAATVLQVCRFYYMLAYGQLINCTRSEQMMDYLYDPRLHHKFVHSLDKIAPEADLYRKSGTWRNFHADSIMVIGNKWRSYILVALIDDPNGESIMRNLVLKVDDLLNDENE